MLKDTFGRKINYLRLAVTDRCNLRCFYCMPEEGIKYIDRKELLSYEELLRIVRLLVPQGINKVRITGGEPFLRKDMMPFLTALSQETGLDQINITTNGVLTKPHLPALKKLGIHTINFSLDSLDPKRFKQITNRDEFHKVWDSLEQSISLGFNTKINAVVMDNKNIDDLIPMAKLTINANVEMRFIEEMPFNGGNHNYERLTWDHVQILKQLKTAFPNLKKINSHPTSTAVRYKIPNAKGSIGIIAAYTRNFCGTCNRIRITPQGMLKTCLYDNGVFNIKKLMRAGASNNQIIAAISDAIRHKEKDGYAAESKRINRDPFSESMATIGG